MKQLPYLQTMLALHRDGFNEHEKCGTVEVSGDIGVSLDDPVTDFVSSNLSKSLVEVMELQFAAGAQFVVPLHIAGKPLRNLAEAKAWAAATPMGTMQLLVGCAHVMGGCAMGGDAARSVVDDWGRHRAIENLTVIDGSVFPTSVGANPQESIYATAAKNAGALAKSLKA